MKKGLIKIGIVAIMLVVVAVILLISQNYIKDKYADKANLIINNNNVTAKLKKDIFIDDNDIVFVSKEDIDNFFDGQIYYDKENKLIITTSETKVAKLYLNKKEITINGSTIQTISSAVQKDGTIYIPISEMENVYNIEVNIEDNNHNVVIDSLDRQLIKADVNKNVSVKHKKKILSKTVDKIKAGDKVVLISEEDGWTKIRTQKGNIGYIKSKNIANKTIIRETLKRSNQIEEKISLVWDYYSEYVTAPNRQGTKIEGINVVSPSFFALKQGDGVSIIDNSSKQYVEWAKSNGYKVWAIFSNNSMRETTSKILQNYELREELIEKIVDLAVKNNLDGINIDFENMNMSDKNVFSRFIIELAPRLREYGIVTSVDVTAPDGSENWSLCYNRKVISEAADYIVFMAYDQYGISSVKPGTTAGHNWVEANIKKFLGQEDVEESKIILGMPLYTRLWRTDNNGKVTSVVVNMNKIDTKLPNDVERKWDEELKQYYVEYSSENYKYEMWVEDEKSIKEKLKLINEYNLAGGAYWEKDRETDNIWNITKEILEIK